MLFREVEEKDEGRRGRIGSYGSSPPIRHIYDDTWGLGRKEHTDV